MGQDMRDCHALWKRRVDRKIVFMKLDVMGVDSKYKWTVYKAKSGEKFEQVSTGVNTYESKYFGTYKSHVDSDINTANYRDSRSVVWNSPTIKYGLLFIVLSLFIAVPYLMRQFDPEKSSLIKTSRNQASYSVNAGSTNIPASINQQPNTPVSTQSKEQQNANEYKDYLQAFLQSGSRIRLTSVLSGMNRSPYVVIEFRDSSYRIVDRLDTYMLSDLGWSVEIKSLKMVRVYKKGYPDMIATAWPLEVQGEVSDRQNEGVRRASKVDEGNKKEALKEESQIKQSPSEETPKFYPGIGRNQVILTGNGGASSIDWASGRVQ